jgi:hypothetical protein
VNQENRVIRLMVSHDEFVQELCKALGLPLGRTQSFTLKVEAGKPVELSAVLLPLEPNVDEQGVLITLLKRYELHEKEDELQT